MIAGLLDETAAGQGDRTAVRDGTGSWTYRELAEASRVVAGSLAALGVEAGDRLLCAVPGGRLFAAVLYGALRLGAVLVPLPEDAGEYQLRTVAADASPRLVIGGGPGQLDPRGLLAGAPLTAPPVAGDRPAFMIYTSGSTGAPKGIVCPHQTVLWAARAIADVVGYRDTDVIWVRLPVSFDYGLYQLLLALLAGAQVVFPGDPLSARELHAIRLAGATVVPLVPTLAGVLCALAARDRRPTSVRLLTNTGAALLGADAQRVRAAFPGAALIAMYGMSECKRISVAAPDEDLAYPGTVGRALPGTRLMILDEHGDLAAPHVTGEIVSAGPHVMAGYWRAERASAERFVASPDGIGRAVRTGDFGYLDQDGRLYFVGRRDDIFKRRGWRTSSGEIEAAMLDIPGVSAAACVPPGEDGVLTVWAVTELDAAAVVKGIGARLGAAKTPDRCVTVASLPQTAHGKVDKVALRGSLAGTRAGR